MVKDLNDRTMGISATMGDKSKDLAPGETTGPQGARFKLPCVRPIIEILHYFTNV